LDHAIAHANQTFGFLTDLFLVGDDNDRDARSIESLQLRQNFILALRIQIPCRFVGDDDPRTIDL